MVVRSGLAAGLLLAVVIGGCETSAGQAPQETVVIASDLPMSGKPGDVLPLVHAIQLAANANHDLGRFRLEYMPLDDSLGHGASPTLGVQNVKHMLADPRVMGMIGPFNSYVLWDEIPRANPDLVMLSPSSTNICVTEPPGCTNQIDAIIKSGHINFFRLAAPDEKQGTAMGRYAGSLGIKRVAVLDEWVEYGSLVEKRFEDEFAATGGRVVWKAALPNDTQVFSDFLAAAQGAGAEAVYVIGDGKSDNAVCQIGPQMIRSNFKYLLVNDGAGATDDTCLTNPPSGDMRIYGTFADVWPDPSQGQRAATVIAAYKSAFPQDPVPWEYTFAAYDCAMILIDAIENVIKTYGGAYPTRERVLEAVANGTFGDGITGSYSFDNHGDAVSPLMGLWTVNGAHWVYVEQLNAGPRPVS